VSRRTNIGHRRTAGTGGGGGGTVTPGLIFAPNFQNQTLGTINLNGIDYSAGSWGGPYTAQHVTHPSGGGIDIATDPAGVQVSPGVTRKVVKFRVYNAMTSPTPNPRAQLESPQLWQDGQDYYVGYGVYLPTAVGTAGAYTAGVPVMTQSSNWMNLGDVYGLPFADTSPNTVMLHAETGSERLVQIIQGAYNSPRLNSAWFFTPTRDIWHDLVIHWKLATDLNGVRRGFSEAWRNSGQGWVKMLTNGQQQYTYTTMSPANDQAPNYHKIGHYRVLDMWNYADSYACDHKIATTFAAAAPRSYGAPPATPPT
jgi:hypothetical protein